MTDDDTEERIWALPFMRRCSILILGIVALHRETAPCIHAFAKMSIQMSRFSNSQERAMAIEELRNAADEIERPLLVSVT